MNLTSRLVLLFSNRIESFITFTFSAKIIATDATIQGVSEFSVANITQLDGTNKVTVELVVPFVKIDSKFEMHGKVSIPFAPAINDNGPLQ